MATVNVSGLKQRIDAFHDCLRNVNSLSAGQVSVDDIQWTEEMSTVNVIISIRPDSGAYVNGRYIFRVFWSLFDRKEAPEVTCLTRIYHPNIDPTETDYNVCLSVLSDWQPSFELDDVIQGLLYLFHNPNLSDPLSPYFDPDMDEEEFLHNARQSLLGLEVEDCYFDKVLTDTVDVSTTTNACASYCR